MSSDRLNAMSLPALTHHCRTVASRGERLSDPEIEALMRKANASYEAEYKAANGPYDSNSALRAMELSHM
jgi:hypothetical protein